MKIEAKHPPMMCPGEVVWAIVKNLKENPNAGGKPRPVLLVRPDGEYWWVMGMTHKTMFEDGNPRSPVPNWNTVGLPGPGHLWSPNLAHIPEYDVLQHIGWVDTPLAEAVVGLCVDLTTEDEAVLRAVADALHPVLSASAQVA